MYRMQRLEVSGAVRPLHGSLGVKVLRERVERSLERFGFVVGVYKLTNERLQILFFFVYTEIN